MYTTNKAVLSWIDEMAAMTKPDKIVWIDGSEEQLEELRQEAYKTGELIKLNEKELPGCVYHRSAINDVARVEGRTFICCEKKEDAGPTNNWMDPAEMYLKLRGIYDGAMKGRTMYVIPYSMSIIGSPFAKYGIELTDSIYVVVSMAIMTRMGKQVFDALGDSPDFIKGLHSKAQLDEENRYIVQFPQDNTIWSVNSGYGGNVLLGKKCFALRIASVLGRREGWMAEHMLILGVQDPEGNVTYITGAFPSACGKTNLAMIIPPQVYRDKGWKCWTVGDDIAWIRPGPDGRLWACNPENGFFGVAPGTNMKSNPNAMLCTKKNSRTSCSSPTSPFGGRAWIRILPREPSTGRASPGIPQTAPRALIRTPASRARLSTAPASPPSITTRTACPSALCSSAAAAPRPLPWYIRAATGTTAYSWAPPSPPRPPLPLPALSA